jgi:hypothetical protein
MNTAEARFIAQFPQLAPNISTLQRAARALSRWAEAECNGDVERDETTGKTYRAREGERLWACRDMESGAIRTLDRIMKAAGLHWYHQTDPRGLSVYVSPFPLTYENYSDIGTPLPT